NSYYELSSPFKIYLWKDKNFTGVTPNGRLVPPEFFLSCFSESDFDNGACPLYPSWGGAGSNVSLAFYEKNTNMKHVAIIGGTRYAYGCLSTAGITDAVTGCPGGGLIYNIYITSDELKKFPVGGVWSAHLRLKTGQWHGGPGSVDPGWPGFMSAEWKADITLNVIDNKNIHIWFPLSQSGTTNVVMPIIPAYWTLNKPGVVTSEKTIDACLYDGYSNNSKTFKITFNSNNVDAVSGDFILRNNLNPDKSTLPYQVLVASPGSSDTVQQVKPGVQLSYSGINFTGSRQVMIPGLHAPVACIPWPIKIKLKPFNLSKQQAGHYTGTLDLIFTPSL
ncbi:hypothetical protein AOS13_24225, partial [Salmonella enterica]|nr:hypothetical protein [Salmonella enterica]